MYRGSPLLEYEAGRLERTVQLKQELFLTITKAYEEARITEVRDTPILTIIDRAVAPVRRSSPRRKLMVYFALGAGAVVASGMAYLLDFRNTVGAREEKEYRDLLEAWATARRQMREALRQMTGRA